MGRVPATVCVLFTASDVEPLGIRQEHPEVGPVRRGEVHGAVDAVVNLRECPNTREIRLMEDERAFFERMRQAVSQAFEESSVRRKQERQKERWAWHVCALPFRRDSDLLLGLNWGQKRGRSYTPQTEPPGDESATKISGWDFIKRSLVLLKTYGFNLAEMNYFNMCPFRAPSIDDLEEADWQLSIDRFFLDAIGYVRPPRTLILGTTAVKQLERRNLVSNVKWLKESDGTQNVFGARGDIAGQDSHVSPFYAVPHPNARIGAAARSKIWTSVFRDSRK